MTKEDLLWVACFQY